MKETFRERIAMMLIRITNRIEMLENNIKEYKEVDNFEDAMKCDIKRRTLVLIQESLIKELQS